MQPHQQRVVTELDELATKIGALTDFMHGDVYSELPSVDQGLLMVQLVAMQNYESALTRRIKLF
jgi:hypothetical protein